MKKLLALVAATSMLAGCGLSLPGMNTGNDQKVATKRKLPKGAKKWTVMVHLAADNNLYNFGLQDLNEMEAGINADDVNVIVLFDGNKQGDSAVYEVKKDPAGKNTTFVSTPMTDLPFIPANKEINSGDVNVVKAFGEWAIAKYPAEHYMMSYWDHGSGIFRGGDFITKGFGWDDNGTHLNTNDLSNLTPAFAKVAGQPIDVVGFDACLMAHAEIAYQMKGSAKYLVASEELEPGAGWDYAGWLKNVTGTTAPAQMADVLVKSYAGSYSGREDLTLSATSIDALTGKLVPAMNNLSAALVGAMPAEKATIAAARTGTQSFYNKDCADIGSFAKQLLASNVSAGVKAAAQDVLTAVGATVTSEVHSASRPNATGLVAYFPNANQSYNAKYDNPALIAFSSEGWKNFLKALTQK
ncbi:MAG TPA: clostripain-related cysteine peptidase [Pantanalinema sp.]